MMNMTFSTSDGETEDLAGTVVLQITATAPISTGDFYVDDVLISSDASAPYEYSWDTTLESNGSHELKGKISYGRHQAKDSKLLVTVLNPFIPTQEEETMIQESPELIE